MRVASPHVRTPTHSSKVVFHFSIAFASGCISSYSTVFHFHGCVTSITTVGHAVNLQFGRLTVGYEKLWLHSLTLHSMLYMRSRPESSHF